MLPPEAADPLPSSLTQFLADARPLVVLTAGTAVASCPAWIHHGCEAALALGCKVIVISRDPSLANSGLANNERDVRTLAYAPFTSLLAQASMLIHHGGIGSMASCMQAGLPQIAVPSAHDQSDNAARAAALGLGFVLKPGASTEAWRSAIHACMHDSAIRESVGRIQALMAAQADAAEFIADLALGFGQPHR